MSRSYADAIASLNTLQSNFAIVDAIRKSGRQLNEQSIPEMIDWCRKIGYAPSDFDRLNVIHIAGTKGKGSTAAFISSILTQHLGTHAAAGHSVKPLSKVGLFTSPHLRFVRERIQINGQPLTEEKFAYYFFETWDRLESAAQAAGNDPNELSCKPVYFRFLTLMAFHTYMSEAVDAAIIECGIGGEYDSTNVVEQPVVTAITSLGIDHVGMLGGTIEEIAWHKAGIMKKTPDADKGICFTTASQPPKAKPVLEKVANEKDTELVYVEVDPSIANGSIRLGLEGDFQKTNASLALAVAQSWLAKQGFRQESDPISEKSRKGLETVKWPGRCDTRTEPGITWCIDGGHTLDSIEQAGKWFASHLQSSSSGSRLHRTGSSRYLIFNQQTRDAPALARALHSTLTAALQHQQQPDEEQEQEQTQPFTHAIFTTNTTYKEMAGTGQRAPDLMSSNVNAADVAELRVQKQLAAAWGGLDPGCAVAVVSSIEEAVDLVRLHHQQQQQQQPRTPSGAPADTIALVTGSLHLVGGFLEILEGKNAGH